MAATVLNSERAVQMSLFVVRAFVKVREMLGANRDCCESGNSKRDSIHMTRRFRI